jgi:hypothetical protein
MAIPNWRTINIDLLDPDSSSNFDTTSLAPSIVPISTAEVQHLSSQIKQLLRGGDAEGALRGALENVPYGADGSGKVGQFFMFWDGEGGRSLEGGEKGRLRGIGEEAFANEKIESRKFTSLQWWRYYNR